jgi:hypothetical protein
MNEQENEKLVEHILDKMKEMLKRHGFCEVVINGTCNYQKKELYCIPQYVSWLGFLIEYADSREEAEKNWYEDGDAISLRFGENYILQALESEIIHELEKKLL